MNRYQRVTALGLVSAIALLASSPSGATETSSSHSSTPTVHRLTDLKGTKTQAQQLLAQTEQAAVIAVTDVQVNPTETGVQILLITAQTRQLQAETRNEDNTFIAEIPNAVLRLQDGQSFQVENPTANIQSITIRQGSNNQIEIRAIGQTTLPIVTVQTQSNAPIAQASPTDEGEEEIVITADQAPSYRVPSASTATGTDTRILDAPVSIQVVPKDVIRDQQATRLEEVTRNVSGVTFSGENFGRGGRFSIRGFDDAPVLRDGFRNYGFSQATPEVANLEQVEVLKGPASILYGEIQPGGVLNLVAKKPLANPFAELELQLGRRNFVQPRLDLSGPLNSEGTVLYRLNALFQNNDGFRDYEKNIIRSFVAPTLAIKVNPQTDLNLSLEYLSEDRPADLGIAAVGNKVGNTRREQIVNEPDDNVSTNYVNVGYNLEHRFNPNWKIRNAFRYTFYGYDYNVIALPLFVDNAGFVDRFYASQEGESRSYTMQTNVVGQFATGGLEHTLLFGVDLNHSDTREFSVLDPTTLTTLDIFNPVYGQLAKPNEADLFDFGGRSLKSDRLGIYLQDQIAIQKNLKLLLGVRYDAVTQKAEALPGLAVDANETEITSTAWTPRFGILYQPTESLSFYGSYSRSFTPSANTTVNGDPLEPERGEGWEVGVKTELFNKKLLATLAYFDVKKQNVAVPDPDFPLSFISSGEQRSRGVELDLAGEILPGWKFIASYAYINAEVTQDSDSSLIGNRLFGVPEHSASLWTTYEVQQGSLQGLGIGVGFNYVGDRQGDLDNSYQADGYFVTNAAIFYRRNNWRLGLNFKNIGNVNYIESVQNVRASRNYFGEPFTVIGSFSVQF
ncbi:TonB-dependent siderophore receptor [Alkalinema pantanalense CENA528]|uniref:TonB-dependent siderophore receptor n=1 Tax=Alkalinema pantanalense TaxID=1620705 RepID=UPI003D6E2292